MKNKVVLITYCWNRVGYNILQSLSSSNYKVIVADSSKYNICSFSKYKYKKYVYKDPFLNEESFIDDLLNIIKKHDVDILLPTHDEGIVIARNINRFPKNVLICVDEERKLINMSNKNYSTNIAKKLKIPTPIEYSIEDLLTYAQYPLVIKGEVGNSSKNVYVVHSYDESRIACEKLNNVDYLIQEHCGDCDYCVDCVRYGSFTMFSVYKAILTKTGGGGTTTQRITVDFKLLEDYSKRILDYFDYNGVCGIDFRVDESTNNAFFIEINARYSGGIATSIAAGFDIPLTHVQLMQGIKVRKTEVKVGVKTKWILGDLITLVTRLLSFSLKREELKSIFNFNFVTYDDFRKDDILAFIGEFAYYLVKFLKKRKLNP